MYLYIYFHQKVFLMEKIYKYIYAHTLKKKLHLEIK